MPSEKYYYDILDDINSFPSAWCYIVPGGRNTGKTYSSLKAVYEQKIKFIFIKRTMEDIKMLCSGKLGADLSPFKSINRDIGSNIQAKQLHNGIGIFVECDDEGEPISEPIGYLLAMSAVQKFKGFDLSDCDWIIFDEFIPQLGERVNRKEGELLLDLYKTVSRDREHRGRPALKLILLANATCVSSPITDTLEITDYLAEMDMLSYEYRYDQEREILIHMLRPSKEFKSKEEQSHIYKAMAGTNWASMALENKFAYNDMSNIGKINMKGFKPYIKLKYKHHNFFIYTKDGKYYMTKAKSPHVVFEFNLNRENDQKLFYLQEGIDLRNACIEGNMVFEKYTMYDLIVNYKKKFDV